MRARSSIARLLSSSAGAILLGVASACASETTRRLYPDLPPVETARAAGYETPPQQRASDLLPEALLSGPHHRVEEVVASDGFRNIYTVTADFGSFEAYGDDLLDIRIGEIEALAALREKSKTREFASAAAAALKSPFVATWNLITDPVDTITGLPVGVWETVKRTSRVVRGKRGELEGSALGEIFGFEAVKRQLAYQLGVDPYSSNKWLQRELNRFAWASYAGGLPGKFVPFRKGTSVTDTPEPTLLRAGERLNEILRHFSPEDLGRLNRIELAVMGVREEPRDAFIHHPWYSLRHETVLVGSLSVLDLTENRTVFIETALGAASEEDALFYQRSAELIRAYHEESTPIGSMVSVRPAVAGYTESQILVIPLVVDHVIWSEPVARFVRDLRDRVPAELEIQETELLLSGTASERARRELGDLGFRLTENAFEHLRQSHSETARGDEPEHGS